MLGHGENIRPIACRCRARGFLKLWVTVEGAHGRHRNVETPDEMGRRSGKSHDNRTAIRSVMRPGRHKGGGAVA